MFGLLPEGTYGATRNIGFSGGAMNNSVCMWQCGHSIARPASSTLNSTRPLQCWHGHLAIIVCFSGILVAVIRFALPTALLAFGQSRVHLRVVGFLAK